MRVRLDKYQGAHTSMQTKTIFMIICGSLGVVLFSFVLLLGILLIAVPEGTLWERRGGFFVAIFTGLFPLVASVFVVWKGFSFRARFAKIKELAAFARTKPVFSREEMGQALSLNPQDAEKLFLEAVTEHVLVAGPEDYEPRMFGPGTVPPPTPDRVVVTPNPRGSGLNTPVQFVGGQPAHFVDMGPTAPASPVGVTAPATPVSIGPGTLLNDTYRIDSPLGAGGMGEVFVATHTRTGRKYALKTLHADTRLSADAIKRFEREALAASALGHPNIVAVHDFNHEGELYYLVMDLLVGETLETRLGRVGSLPFTDAQKLALEIGSALATAHDAGLLHRDIKPANVLLTAATGSPERAVLLDFGLVKTLGDGAVSRITATGAAVGTPMYMSPEQARGEPLAATSDVYSLGALVYEMVTGAPPFLDRTLAEMYARLLTETATRASKVATRPLPHALDAVLDRALAKDPKDRYPSARAFMAALAEVSDEAAPSTLRIA
jgi:tRNA A-37 threonylcarbamoyl transferase component Bud32